MSLSLVSHWHSVGVNKRNFIFKSLEEGYLEESSLLTSVFGLVSTVLGVHKRVLPPNHKNSLSRIVFRLR